MQHRKTTALLLCALFTALIAVSAFIRIPAPLVPITLQSGTVLLSGILLGVKNGAKSVLIYVLLGLAGVPIFTMGGGISYVFQPTFGYLFGFIIGAYIAGVLAWKKTFPTVPYLFCCALAGLAAIYLIGTVYCYWISTFVLGTELAFWPLLVSCCLVPLPGDLLLCLLTAHIGKRLRPFTRSKINS